MYWCDHFTIYTNIKSFCCTSETNRTLYVNYTSIKKRGISETCPNYSYNMGKFIIFGKKKKMLVTYMTFHSPAQKDIPRFNNSPNQTVRKAILTRSQKRGHKFPDSKIICKLKENIHPKWKLKRVL